MIPTIVKHTEQIEKLRVDMRQKDKEILDLKAIKNRHESALARLNGRVLETERMILNLMKLDDHHTIDSVSQESSKARTELRAWARKVNT